MLAADASGPPVRIMSAPRREQKEQRGPWNSDERRRMDVTQSRRCVAKASIKSLRKTSSAVTPSNHAQAGLTEVLLRVLFSCNKWTNVIILSVSQTSNVTKSPEL